MWKKEGIIEQIATLLWLRNELMDLALSIFQIKQELTLFFDY